MKVNAFALTAASVPLFIAGAAQAGLVGLAVRAVDPTTMPGGIGSVGTWAANGGGPVNQYPVSSLDTYRVYVQFNAPDAVLAVGDLFIGGAQMNLSTDAPTFHNGGIANGDLQAPTDLTAAGFWQAQWDTYLKIDGLATVSFAPGLEAALGAVGGDDGFTPENSFNLDNTGWNTTPAGNNTVFNGASGFHESMILQMTVAEGFDIWGTNIIITTLTANSSPLSFHSIPAPGALALLGLAGLTGSSRRRRQA